MFNSISPQEKIDFAKNLAVMLKGSMTINEAVKALLYQTKSREMKKVLESIKNDLESGISLSESLKKEEKRFGNVFTSVIRAGEASGTLEGNLDFLADWLDRNNSLKKEISSVLLYPKIVLIATVVLGGGLTIFILPKLVPIFSGMNIELPTITKIILAISTFIGAQWLLIVSGIIGIWILWIFLNRVRFVKKDLQAFYLSLPFVGNLIVCYELALFSQLTSTLLRSGMSINEAINVSLLGTSNLNYFDSLKNILEKITQGISFTEAIKLYPKLYPPNFVNIVSVGEHTGTLQLSFKNLSEFYSKEIITKTKNLPTVIEPILLVIIGVGVGVVAISIVLPIYSLTGRFTK